MQKEVMQKLLAFISRNFFVEVDEINLEESLIDEGIIDSFGLIEITEFINKEFSISITESEMNRDNFGSATKIVGYICRKVAK